MLIFVYPGEEREEEREEEGEEEGGGTESVLCPTDCHYFE